MALSLITPLVSNFMKDFPGQNAVNLNAIDEFAGPCLTTHPLQTYLPNLSAVTTVPNLGTGGVIRGYYYEIFDQIYTWGEFKFGSAGISSGSGAFLVTLPFPAKSIMGPSATFGQAPSIGNGFVYDDSTLIGRQAVSVFLRTSTQMGFGVRLASGAASSDVGSASPITWAVQDAMYWCARYQRQA